MWECFFPDSRAVSAYEIAYETYYEKGYRGIIFDIDNTLVEHGRDATKRAVELLEKLREIGFATALLSNNKKERVDRFNKEIGTHVVWKAGKPGKKDIFSQWKRCTRQERRHCLSEISCLLMYGAQKGWESAMCS